MIASPSDKPLIILSGDITTPPLSFEARIEAGFLIRRLQKGESLTMPYSRPVPSVGTRCHELRIIDAESTWRVMYRVDSDAILVIEVFAKKTQVTPKHGIDTCRKRLREWDRAN